jgi:C4-dicarboxylate-specific signal transduction histidine kinase
MLELWAPSITPASQSVITHHTPPNNPQADFASSAHLQVMGELTASIAHEICQPLLAIASNAAACIRWLQRENPVVSEAIEGLRDIRADCERAANIVAALRALTRQSLCNPQLVSVNDLILEAVRLHGPALAAGNVALVIDLRADQPVNADPVQVQQLVFNVIANAMEAMAGRESPGAIVRLSSSTLPDGVQVSVEDNGPGIPVEDRQRIFEAFHTTKKSGLGMGLTICRSVVEAHKGNLYAEGSELGGAMIRFQLPTGCKNH